MAPVNYALLTSHNEVFASIAAVAGLSATLNGDRPEKIQGRRVTHNFFDLLGVTPALGRVFRADEDRPGAQRVAILSHSFWRDRFGGDPAIVGRDLLLDNSRVIVVGVMPAGFQFLGGDVGLWMPASLSPQQLASGANQLTIVARLETDGRASSRRSRIWRASPPDCPPTCRRPLTGSACTSHLFASTSPATPGAH